MKAAVTRQNKGLLIKEIPKPIVEADQVLVQTVNVGFCGSDHSLVETPGIPDGMILGHEVSGVVVETGTRVENVPLGKRVIIRPTYCGKCRECKMGKTQLCSTNRRSIGIGDLPGAFAEYVVVYPQMLIPIPENVDSRNAALAEAYAVSLHALNCIPVKAGSVLVMGCGTIGLTMVQILKLQNFGPIVVSEPIKEKRQLALKFGADDVINPYKENMMQRVLDTTNGIGFKVVLECAGVPALVQASLEAAAKGGSVCQLSVMFNNIRIDPSLLMFKEILLTASYGNTHEENIRCLKWMSEGKLEGRPLISDLILLEQLPETYQKRIHPGKAIKVLLKIGEEF